MPLLTETDPTAVVSTEISGAFSDMTSTLTGVIVPALFGVVVVGIIIALAVKYIKRGSSKA